MNNLGFEDDYKSQMGASTIDRRHGRDDDTRSIVSSSTAYASQASVTTFD